MKEKENLEEVTGEPIEEPEESTNELTEKLTEDPLEVTEEPIKKSIKELVKEYRKLLICVMLVLIALLVFYIGMALYFHSHFYFGTEINGIKVSGKTLKDAKAVMVSELKTYALNVKERGGKIEEIKAQDVGLRYSSEADFKKIKDGQYGFSWVVSLFKAEDLKKTVKLKYDERLLRERISQLGFFKPENIVEPKNPSFKYVDKSYVIIGEIIGNKIDEEKFYTQVVHSISIMKPELDLELTGCYIKPQYNAKSKKVLEVRNTLNKYVATEVTYVSGDTQKILDGAQINQWLKVNENLEVTVDAERVKEYINEIARTFNTVGKTRNFVTSSGATIKVSGGDYGRSVDKVKETQEMISVIKTGKTITREPIYKQNPFSQGNDIGRTYVEISIPSQHLWFYKNGSLVAQGDIVTGNLKLNRSTHKGIYSLKYKARNVVLRGPDYAAPVTFWMPFDGGIGIHDASWRSRFGGNIYKTNGSHGCVNAPYSLAKKIFNNIQPGTPVVCY